MDAVLGRRDSGVVSSQVVPQDETPDTVAGWQALVEGQLTNMCCAFHRNMEISSRYAWMYNLQPARFKWAAMAAFASHHVRLALFPLRLDTDGGGYVDIPRSLGRKRLLTADVDTIRATNNAIFNDIFWVHLAYASADDGIERLRVLLRPEPSYASVLAGFETIDRGSRVLEDATASVETRRAADDLIWEGTVQLLEHEQRALVQPHFDRPLVRVRQARLGRRDHELRGAGMRREVAYFTSFYLHALRRGVPHSLGEHRWPRITHFEDRWRWLETSVVPRFRRLEAEPGLIRASLRRIAEEARVYASIPCVPPLSSGRR